MIIIYAASVYCLKIKRVNRLINLTAIPNCYFNKQLTKWLVAIKAESIIIWQAKKPLKNNNYQQYIKNICMCVGRSLIYQLRQY